MATETPDYGKMLDEMEGIQECEHGFAPGEHCSICDEPKPEK